MGEDDMQTALVPLPPELRALVDFLSLEERPTAIVHILASTAVDDAPPETVVYLNPAFHRLSRPDRELEDLRQAIMRTRRQRLQPGLAALHGCILDGERWQTRVSTEYCIASTTEAWIAPGGQGVDAVQPSSNHDNAQANSHSHTAKPKKYLDWTQHDIAGASPWIQFLRNFNWASTGIGPMQSWSVVLRQYMLSIMANPNPRIIVWGAEMTFIYNEACIQLFGDKHPACLGQHTSVPWAEAWADIKPLLDAAYDGQVTNITHQHLSILRDGFLEETYWDFTLLPIFSPEGYAMGVFDELTETTLVVTGERRRNRITQLNKYMAGATTLRELWPAVIRALEDAEVDIPFALIYAVVDDVPENGEVESSSSDSWSLTHSKCAKLAGTFGISEGHPDAIDSFTLLEHIETGPGLTQPCRDVWKNREPVTLSVSDDTLPSSLASAVPGRSFGDPVREALVSPIKSSGADEVLGILVTGLNPRSAFAGEYSLFMNIMVDFIEKAAALISLPEEQRRAKKIAEDMNNALAQQLRLTTLKAERSEAKFSRLAASAPTGMFMFDADNRPLFVNDTYLQMVGNTIEEHYAMARNPEVGPWQGQIHEADIGRFAETWERVTKQKAPITIEYRLKRPWQSIDKSTGQEMTGETWLLATAFPEIEADGTVSTVQGWLTDISHRKFSENLLAQRLEDALENKRQTENFIDMTSHEMRNPLSAILQSADSIVSFLEEHMSLPTNTIEDIVDAAQTIILCAQHQKRIVDDILTLSKLDASLLVISPDKVRPPTLVKKALKMYEAEIERAGIDAQLCIEPTYDELAVDWVLLDPSRLLQIIINLLTNSIKFTQHSEVRKIQVCLGASYQKPTGKHHGISFAPPRQIRQARTPEPDSHPDTDVYLQFGVYDTGRGLNDEEIKMLFKRFQQASPKTYNQYGGSGLGLFISRELCELLGGQIGVASKDEYTVFAFFVKAKLLSGDKGMSPRPDRNRFMSVSASPIAATRRASIAVQGVMNQMTSRETENGMKVEELQAIPQKPSITPTRGIKSVEEAASVTSEKNILHVLIVEDNLINQKVLSQQLWRAGCVVHVANHGLAALEFLEKSSFCSGEIPLSIILLDLEMPTMDGMTCIRHIRERQVRGEINSHVPVIAVTANARLEQIAYAIEAGMDQVVTKPFRILELVPQMEALVAEIAVQRMHSEGT